MSLNVQFYWLYLRGKNEILDFIKVNPFLINDKLNNFTRN